jgi:hypothetical protein
MSHRSTGQGCALILADTWPEKIGKGLIFISLNVEPATREAAVDVLHAELETKGVPVKDGSCGYMLLVVDDLDGNQLFFNYPSETQRPLFDSLAAAGRDAAAFIRMAVRPFGFAASSPPFTFQYL